MIVVLMGVTGTGKTTIGRILAQNLGWNFYDADLFHPKENVKKMSEGTPLQDKDRWPWLDILAYLISGCDHNKKNTILACSALKHAYRERLQGNLDAVHFVHLFGDQKAIQERLEARSDSFMNPVLLQSQFDTLEPPIDAIEVDVTDLWGRARHGGTRSSLGTSQEIASEIQCKLKERFARTNPDFVLNP